MRTTRECAQHGLNLTGSCNLFAGARASADAKLGIGLFKGVKASLDADAFFGVEASVTGGCTFTYGGETVLGASGTAAVQIGYGDRLAAH